MTKFALLLSILAATLLTPATAAGTRTFKAALPGYTYKFPQDHYAHEAFKTEWWYYTGHLQGASDKTKNYGFELTFFRSGVPIDDGVKSGAWQMQNIYMAHFALSDLSGQQFFHQEKMARAGVSRAGASSKEYRVWLENWSVYYDDRTRTHFLHAKSKDFAINLALQENKPAAIHGQNGVSQKANCLGCASHYYSLSRLPARGQVTVRGQETAVTGTAWMDHEFGSNQLTGDQVGWDWFSIQLDDKSEIMLYVMRLRDKTYDPQSSGTVIAASGKTTHLSLNEYTIDRSQIWTSPHTGGKYPQSFIVKIPSQKLELKIDAALADQELVDDKKSGVSYWEGACQVTGVKADRPIKGRAYVELTGYAKAFDRQI